MVQIWVIIISLGLGLAFVVGILTVSILSYLSAKTLIEVSERDLDLLSQSLVHTSNHLNATLTMIDRTAELEKRNFDKLTDISGILESIDVKTPAI